MKVEQKTKFTPITITLETEKEAEALWYALVYGGDEKLLKECPKERKLALDKRDEPSLLFNNMFSNYDAVYNAEGGKA